MKTSKTCTKCELTKELTEFNKKKKSDDGHRPECRECQKKDGVSYRKTHNSEEDIIRLRKNSRRHYENNIEKEKARNRVFRENNKEHIKSYRKKYQKENKEFCKAATEEWKKKNHDKHIANKKEWYMKNQEAQLKRRREYSQTPAGIISGTTSSAKRRAAKFNTSIDNTDHENYLIGCVYIFCRFKTRVTGIEHHVDHKQPFAKGGLHHPDNLQILTATENLQKGAKVA